jgi:hypothetical protein
MSGRWCITSVYALERNLLVHGGGHLAPGKPFLYRSIFDYWGVSYYLSSDFRVLASCMRLVVLFLSLLVPRLF